MHFEGEIRHLVDQRFPDKANTNVLDAGAGSGKYRSVLFDYSNLDAVEIWEPYIEHFRLEKRYRNVFRGNVRAISKVGYDVVIYGDMLEHLTPEDARLELEECAAAGALAIVVVPYEYPQDAVGGNPHEEHLQDDLTHEIMRERYPMLRCELRHDTAGLYVLEPEAIKTGPLLKTEKVKLDLTKVRLAIGTPAYGGEVSLTYCISSVNTVFDWTTRGLPLHWLTIGSASVEKARNMLVAQFMANDWTHLLFVDADQGWDPRQIHRLLAMDQDVVGVAARKKTMRSEWAVNFLGEEIRLENGAAEVAGVGTGFLMIERQVFERMFEAYPELKIDLKSTESDPDRVLRSDQAEYYYALFAQTLENGRYLGEDLSFCKRWRRIGGRVHIDPVGDVVHIGTYEFKGSVASLFRDGED
jgi:hypothetical protein